MKNADSSCPSYNDKAANMGVPFVTQTGITTIYFKVYNKVCAYQTLYKCVYLYLLIIKLVPLLLTLPLPKRNL